MLDGVPDLFLAGMVGIDGERLQLRQRHAVVGVDVQQDGRNAGKPEPLLHELGRREIGDGDLLVAHALPVHVMEGAVLVERMDADALDVLGKGVVLGENPGARIAHDARHEAVLREALRLHQPLDRPVATTAGRDLKQAGLVAVGVENRTDIEALDQILAAFDVLGQFLDIGVGTDTPDVGLAEHELVERNVARTREDDFLGSFCHGGFSTTGVESLSLNPEPVTKQSAALSL